MMEYFVIIMDGPRTEIRFGGFDEAYTTRVEALGVFGFCRLIASLLNETIDHSILLA